MRSSIISTSALTALSYLAVVNAAPLLPTNNVFVLPTHRYTDIGHLASSYKPDTDAASRAQTQELAFEPIQDDSVKIPPNVQEDTKRPSKLPEDVMHPGMLVEHDKIPLNFEVERNGKHYALHHVLDAEFLSQKENPEDDEMVAIDNSGPVPKIYKVAKGDAPSSKMS